MADLQQQQVEIDPMKTSLLATWTKFFERPGPWGKTAKFTRKKKFSPWIAYEWSGLLSDESLVSERNPTCSSIEVVADGERIQQPQFSSQCAWNGNLSLSQTQNPVRSNSPVQKVACLSLPTTVAATNAPNNQHDLISKPARVVSTRRKKESWSAGGEWRRRISFLAVLPKNNRDSDWFSTILRDEVQIVLH
jgi:hypothetical protein